MGCLARSFGISTHLFLHDRLSPEHLGAVAAAGFDAVEIFCVKPHFDYHDRASIAALGGWLRDAGLRLNSFHAPICTHFARGAWGDGYPTAAADSARRQAAIREVEAALFAAEVLPYRYLVLHLGTPTEFAKPGDNSHDGARRTVEELAVTAARIGVPLALEVIPNPLSEATALVDLIEANGDLGTMGICLDTGHAHLLGDTTDAIETCSGHIVTTHLHDNKKTGDDHLMPYAGTIDWDGALLAFQKVGFDGPWIFELAVSRNTRNALEQAAGVRKRFEAVLDAGGDLTSVQA
jgi:sugar phosphate isomerase/epimerase